MLAQSSKSWKLCNDDLTFLWKIGLVCPPNPACFESYRRFPWAKLLAFPALYCETLWIVCFLHFFDLQKVRLVLGTFTIMKLWALTTLKIQSITSNTQEKWPVDPTVYDPAMYTVHIHTQNIHWDIPLRIEIPVLDLTKRKKNIVVWVIRSKRQKDRQRHQNWVEFYL